MCIFLKFHFAGRYCTVTKDFDEKTSLQFLFLLRDFREIRLVPCSQILKMYPFTSVGVTESFLLVLTEILYAHSFLQEDKEKM